jgi:hypothetical protein
VKASRLLVVALVGGASAFACERSPTALSTRALVASRSTTTTKTGLVACTQAYDSAAQLIGPRGGMLVVGAHLLFVDSLVLRDTVRITAVAPSGAVRWVRFEPSGLLFPANPRDGWGAVLVTNYSDCGVSLSSTLQMAQVSDSLAILTYLTTYVKSRKTPWSQATQYVAALLPHFSNYAVAW